jgi:hypothetical protein
VTAFTIHFVSCTQTRAKIRDSGYNGYPALLAPRGPRIVTRLLFSIGTDFICLTAASGSHFMNCPRRNSSLKCGMRTGADVLRSPQNHHRHKFPEHKQALLRAKIRTGRYCAICESAPSFVQTFRHVDFTGKIWSSVPSGY